MEILKGITNIYIYIYVYFYFFIFWRRKEGKKEESRLWERSSSRCELGWACPSFGTAFSLALLIVLKPLTHSIWWFSPNDDSSLLQIYLWLQVLCLLFLNFLSGVCNQSCLMESKCIWELEGLCYPANGTENRWGPGNHWVQSNGQSVLHRSPWAGSTESIWGDNLALHSAAR